MPVGVTVTLRKQKMYDFWNDSLPLFFRVSETFEDFLLARLMKRELFSWNPRPSHFPEIPTDEVIRSFGVQVTLQHLQRMTKRQECSLKLLVFLS